jgi:hypothetical protein
VIPREQQADLFEIARLLDEAYDHYFANSDGHCKSYEGRISVRSNTYFEREAGALLQIVGVDIASYVLGPNRGHSFDSTKEALKAVRKWHAAEMANEHRDPWADQP